MRRPSDWLLPAGVTLALLAFFAFSLLWPLGQSCADAIREQAETDVVRQGETLANFAKRSGAGEAALRALNPLLAGRDPPAGTRLVLRPARWTGDHVRGLFEADAPQWRWILNSLLLATMVTLLCAALAYPLALWQARTDFPCRTLLSGLLLLPLVLPPFVGAIGLRRLFSRFGALNLALMHLGLVDEKAPIDFLGQYRWAGCVITMVLHFYPLLYLNLTAALSNVDPSLVESARGLGLRPWRVFLRVLLPLSLPGLVAGGSLVFVGAFTDLGTPLIFSFQEVAAKQIYSLANEQSANPAAPALVAVVTLIVLALFAATRVLQARYAAWGGGGGGAKGWTRGARPALRGPGAAAAVGFHVLVIGIAFLPHISVVLAGLGGKWVMTALPEQYTLAHLEEALAHPLARDGVRNSLLYATASTAIDVVLGLACAWAIVRRGGWWGRLLDALTLAPLAIPGIVLAFGYVGTYGGGVALPEAMRGWAWPEALVRDGRLLFPAALLLISSYAVRRLPYTARACAAGLEQTPRNLEEAAGGLGATPLAVIRRVTLPLIYANVAAGAILAFAFAMLEVADSLILANRPADFPLTKAIYALFGRVGDGDQLASALGLFALAFMALSLLAAGAFLGRKWGEMFRA